MVFPVLRRNQSVRSRHKARGSSYSPHNVHRFPMAPELECHALLFVVVSVGLGISMLSSSLGYSLQLSAYPGITSIILGAEELFGVGGGPVLFRFAASINIASPSATCQTGHCESWGKVTS